MRKKLLSLILAIIMILGCFGIDTFAETSLEMAENLVAAAEASKAQSDVNAAYDAIDCLEDSAEKIALYDRADAVFKYISENTAGSYSFSGNAIPAKSDTTYGSMLSSEVIDNTPSGGRKYLSVKYTGLDGTSEGLGQPRDFYENVNWNNKINGIAKMQLTFNLKYANQSYYQLKLRYFSQMAQTELIGVAANGIMAYDGDKNAVIMLYTPADGFLQDKWYTVTALINTTDSELNGIPALSYCVFIEDENKNVIKYPDAIKLYLASGMTDYTTPPASNARSRLLVQAYGSGAKTNAGKCEILVESATISQIQPFTIISEGTSIGFGDKNVDAATESFTINFSERLSVDSAQNVRLFDKNNNIVAVANTVDGNTLTITPADGIVINESYLIDLSQLRDIYGGAYKRYNIPFETPKSYTGIDISKTPTIIKEGEEYDIDVYGLFGTNSEKIESPSLNIGNESIVKVVGGKLRGTARGSTPVEFYLENTQHELFKKKIIITSYYDSLVTESFEASDEASDEKAYDGEKSMKIEASSEAVEKELASLPEGKTCEFWVFPSDNSIMKLALDCEIEITDLICGEWNQIVITNNSVEKLTLYVNGNSICSTDSKDINIIKAIAESGSVYIDKLTTVNCFEYLPVAEDISIIGTAEVGNTLTGSYTYVANDGAPENKEAALIGWLVGDKEANLGEESIRLESNMEGKTIQFFVEPVNKYNIHGEKRFSSRQKIIGRVIDEDALSDAISKTEAAEASENQSDLYAAYDAVNKIGSSAEKNKLLERCDSLQKKIINSDTSNKFDFSYLPTGTTSKESYPNAMFNAKVFDGTESGGKKYLRVTYSGRDDGVDDELDGFVDGQLIGGYGRPSLYNQFSWDAAINGFAKLNLSFNLVQSSSNFYDLRFRYFAYETATELLKVTKSGIIDVTGTVIFGAEDGFSENEWYNVNALINTTAENKQGIEPLTYTVAVLSDSGDILKTIKNIPLPALKDYGEYVFKDYTVPAVNATNISKGSRLGFYTNSSVTETTPGYCEFRISELNLGQTPAFALSESDIVYGEGNVDITKNEIKLTFNEVLNESSVSTVTISDSCLNPLSLTAECEGNTVIINLNEPLSHSESYIINLSGVYDIYGRRYDRDNIPFETQKVYEDMDITNSASSIKEGNSGSIFVKGLYNGEYENIPIDALEIECRPSDIISVEGDKIKANKRGSTVVKYLLKDVMGNIIEKSMTVISYFAQNLFNGYEDMPQPVAFEGLGSLKLDNEKKKITTVPNGRTAELWFYTEEGSRLNIVLNGENIAVNDADDEKWNQLVIVNNSVEGFKIFSNGKAVRQSEYRNSAELYLYSENGAVYIDNLKEYNCFENLPTAKASIAGQAVAGNTLYGGYTYSASDGAKEGETVYGWMLNGSVVSTGNKSYNVTPSDIGKSIQFFAEPVNAYGVKGETAKSSSVTVSRAPQESSTGGIGGRAPAIEKNEPSEKGDPTESSGSAFNDINSHWAKNDIEYMAEQGYIKGMGNGNFEPDNKVKRSEFASLSVRILELQSEPSANIFKDVAQTDWFYNDVLTAYSNGILSGFDGLLRPEECISREEMAVILSNMLGSVEIKEAAFEDEDSISEWAKDAVLKCVSAGILSGDNGKFYPSRFTTRAEMAVVMKNMLAFAEVR